MAATQQSQALATQAQALATLAAQHCPIGSAVLVKWQPKQAIPTPAKVIGHRVEVEAGDAVTVRVLANLEYHSGSAGRMSTRYRDIEALQLRPDEDGSDATTA